MRRNEQAGKPWPLFPLTAHPWDCSAQYREIAPCAALAPYVRCYWGTDGRWVREEAVPARSLVIPDLCMDIIFETRASGEMRRIFCCADDRPYTAQPQGHVRMQFGIRFYAWSAGRFVREPLDHACNQVWPGERALACLDARLHERLLACESLAQRAAVAEAVLLRQLDERRAGEGLPADVLNSVDAVLRAQGNIAVEEIGAQCALSVRQTQRLMRRHMGLSPKQFAALVRYQNTWQALLRAEPVQDIVMRLGYADQAHLIHTFTRYHGMPPGKALALAQDGAFLQYTAGRM